ncbi:hypothetical protein BT63DRAFT_282420 [Microthyrium microscopicum]|uniref:DUF7053 domain-containing protein n=1 Tax=Microthyrium microscopicum TaxID=703497 RepID=A0A6A6UCK3_9PEZI|nr:hypothetical protein BT63DRAFT_282420 [Microthyrium microscopicum]
MKEAPTTTITTPLLEGLAPEKVIAVFHDHDTYIKATCPQLIDYKLESGDATSKNEPVVYSVTDKKPMGQTTYKLTIVNLDDGVDTLVNAKPPVGTLTITGEWRVTGGNIVEKVHLDCNFVMKKMVKSNVDSTHGGQHQELMKIAAAK